ncbi:Calreticulin [Glycine soja]|uniref:Calreticulin n=1 Tax=Glycine soja TaxID=3848 RepID=A0A0B2PP67_GLYSO|nr:Calreticulin [Glycine soja]
MVVKQRYFDMEVFSVNDDHPSHDMAIGQMFVKEHGGFYDHVATSVEGVPNPDGIVGPHPYYFRFDRLRVRVPMFIILPWIDKGTDWKKDENMAGEWNHTSGQWNGDANDKGIQTREDYRFYAILAEYPEFNNKDKILLFQFSVKHE